MVVIEARSVGKKRALVPAWSVSVPTDPRAGGDGGLTLREVIERVVRAEVEAFGERQEARRFMRVLTQREIAEGRANGRIESGEAQRSTESVDVEQAVGTALQAFEDGMYLVILDDAEQRNLDAQVHVSDDSRIVFLRLTFLAGG